MKKQGRGLVISVTLNVLLAASLVACLLYTALSAPSAGQRTGPSLPGGEDSAEVMGGAGADEAELQAWIDNMKALAQKHGVDAYFLQELFPEKIVYSFRGQHVYADLDQSLPQHDYDWAMLTKSETGVLNYTEPSGRQGLVGIDVSKYQGEIDWQKVKDAGVQFAFLRAGYRGYETGDLITDEFFQSYLAGATAVGMPLGVYFFSQAVNADEAKEEADYIIDMLAGYNIQYPIAFDMEELTTSPYRTEALTAAEVTDIALAFCARVQERGYKPMIYGNVSWFLARMEPARLSGIDKWFAQYRPQPYYPYDFTIWQYTHKGSIDGIAGEVDLNISFQDYTAS